mmetsp:Transcript_103941/g.333221  ORF Transcript_103941/g.333221 Transcript_103941/m.333221 type:complete len:91 (-) Transcript_103941:102-374(-)
MWLVERTHLWMAQVSLQLVADALVATGRSTCFLLLAATAAPRLLSVSATSFSAMPGGVHSARCVAPSRDVAGRQNWLDSGDLLRKDMPRR